MSERKPTGIDAIAEAIDGLRTSIRTVIPAQIVKYNATTQRADVQPAIKCRTVDGKILALPQITEAPVQWPRGNGWAIHWTLAPGDTVALAVADRSIDRWLTQGGIVDPQDRRRHDLSDAIVLPGLNTDLDPNPLGATAAVDGLTIGREDGSALIKIGAAGDVEVDADTSIKLGSAAAAKGVNRVGDSVVAGVAGGLGGIVGWAVLVEAAINVLAPGTFTPANNFAATIAVTGGFGTTGPGSGKVTADD